MRIPLTAGVAGQCATTGDAVLVAEAYTHETFEPSADAHTGFVTRSILAVPIRIGSRVVGVLEALNQTEDGFDGSHRELMCAIAFQIAEQLLPHLLAALTAPDEAEAPDTEVSQLRSWLVAESSSSREAASASVCEGEWRGGSTSSNSSSRHHSPPSSPTSSSRSLSALAPTSAKEQMLLRAALPPHAPTSTPRLTMLPDGLTMETLESWELNVFMCVRLALSTQTQALVVLGLLPLPVHEGRMHAPSGPESTHLARPPGRQAARPPGRQAARPPGRQAASAPAPQPDRPSPSPQTRLQPAPATGTIMRSSAKSSGPSSKHLASSHISGFRRRPSRRCCVG
jgi:hypothetical protein